MLDQFLYAFVTLTALMAPLVELPVFLAIVEGQGRGEVRRAAVKVAVGSFFVLATAALAGRLILDIFGVSLPAFRAAGGLVLIVIGLEMLKGSSSGVTTDARLETDPQDRLWVPMVMPLTAGPAAITTAITLSIRERGFQALVPVSTLLAIGAATLVVLILLLAARPVSRVVNPRLARLFERFLGLILVAVGFQMGLTGIHEFLSIINTAPMS